jgi:hypothetical protein
MASAGDSSTYGSSIVVSDYYVLTAMALLNGKVGPANAPRGNGLYPVTGWQGFRSDQARTQIAADIVTLTPKPSPAELPVQAPVSVLRMRPAIAACPSSLGWPPSPTRG